jgi:hypothetical protein
MAIKTVESPGNHAAKPAWQSRVDDFIDDIRSIRFFQPDGKPNPKWRVFYGETWEAARQMAAEATIKAKGDPEWDEGPDEVLLAVWRAAEIDSGKAIEKSTSLRLQDPGYIDRNMAVTEAGIKANAAWDAVYDMEVGADAKSDLGWWASIYAQYLAVADLEFSSKLRYIKYVTERMEAWKKGYGVLNRVDGVLNVYAKGHAPKKAEVKLRRKG